MFKTENTVEMLSLTTVSNVFPPTASLEIILKEKFSSTAYLIATISLKKEKQNEGNLQVYFRGRTFGFQNVN